MGPKRKRPVRIILENIIIDDYEECISDIIIVSIEDISLAI